MKKIATHILLLGAVLAAGPVWATNKCTGPYGRIVFQDAPCQGNETVRDDLALKQKAAQEKHVKDAQTREMQYQAAVNEKTRLAAEAAEVKADAAKVVRIGMSAAEVRTNWGEPNGINTTTTSYGTSEQWIYYRGSYRTQYVYLSNGVVSSTQSTKNY